MQVNFLHGSIWKAPVVGFIEEKSVGKFKISTAYCKKGVFKCRNYLT